MMFFLGHHHQTESREPDATVGRQAYVSIDLPRGGRNTVRSETLYRRSEFGVAVRMIKCEGEPDDE
jgi:hypothetical protein